MKVIPIPSTTNISVQANNYEIVETNPNINVAIAAVSKYTMYEIKDIGKNAAVKRGPFNHYNFFVKQYNNDINRQEDKFMIKIPALWLMLHPTWYILIFSLFMSFVPFMCFLMFVLGIVRLVCCLIVRHRVSLNKITVSNPFLNMIKVPNVSLIDGKTNKYYSFTSFEFTDYLTALGITSDTLNIFVLKCRSNFEKKKPFKFMLFTDEYENYYTKICEKMYLRDILSAVIIFFSIIGIFTTSTILEDY